MGNGVFSENGKAIDKSDAPLVCAMSFFVMRNSFIHSVSNFFQRTNTNYQAADFFAGKENIIFYVQTFFFVRHDRSNHLCTKP